MKLRSFDYMELINILNIFSQKKKRLLTSFSQFCFFVRLHALATCFFFPAVYHCKKRRWLDGFFQLLNLPIMDEKFIFKR